MVIDAIGAGLGVADQLEAKGYEIDRFKGGFRAGDQAEFLNYRAKSYWQFRQRLEEGRLAIPPDDSLFERLLLVRWKPSETERIQFEPKELLRGRLGQSPDRADAATMAFFDPPRNELMASTFLISHHHPWP